MFLKALISVFLAPIMLIGQVFNLHKPEEYVAPISTTSPIVKDRATTTKTAVSKEKATTTKKDIKPVTKKPTATTTEIVKPVMPEVVTDFAVINTNARKTIVNILCTTKYGDLSPISGTGVIINPDGLILTNAHIGQYFLLKDFREKDYLKCIGRTGSPAYPKYNLELVYISQNWVRANKALLKDQNPKGTGEDDFAFLKITGMIDGSVMPKLNYIEPNTSEIINIGEPVLLASYPAGFLGGISILQDLSLTSAVTAIQDVFTFKEGTIDVISVGGTVVSQKGSSGGLVVDKNTSLIGIIATSSDGDTTSSRGLNAITLAYINRTMETEMRTNLTKFLAIDHDVFAKNFGTSIRIELTKLITDELLK